MDSTPEAPTPMYYTVVAPSHPRRTYRPSSLFLHFGLMLRPTPPRSTSFLKGCSPLQTPCPPRGSGASTGLKKHQDLASPVVSTASVSAMSASGSSDAW